ncbi:hypothetical protein N7481_005932 [Penicillium waksmanii]|uniref:uncharacterized protein n=1 Tax=Penicillium waksmanii TaxID=69791 RepID=UPI002548472D|nr:uncharacterized protein N7481_005932 [Penicillium waksmanii]KAJ5983833.1 hypothetical protein N7481_005932 [Penicillium waksmanii]
MLVAEWERWFSDVEDYLKEQHEHEEASTFWKIALESGQAHDREFRGMNLEQHNDQKVTLEGDRRTFEQSEVKLIRMSNFLLLEVRRQITEPLSDEQWQHQREWEEYGFDFGSNTTRYNAIIHTIHAPSGRPAPPFRLGKLVRDAEDPTSYSHNGMWINGMRLRINGLKDGLTTQGWLKPGQSIWLSPNPVTQVNLSFSSGEYRLENDLDLMNAVQTVMRARWPQLATARPIEGRHIIGDWEPVFTLVIRDNPPEEEIRIEEFMAAAYQRSRRDLEAAELADSVQDYSARRNNLLSSVGALLSPNPGHSTFIQEATEPGQQELDFSEFLNELADDNDDASLLALTAGPVPGMDPPTEHAITDLAQNLDQSGASGLPEQSYEY